MRFIKNSELNRPDPDEHKNIKKIPVWIVLDNVRSALNVGSVFRSADAFLIKGVSLCGITAVPPDKDILKSALGATTTVTWKYYSETDKALSVLRDDGYLNYAVEQCDQSVLPGDVPMIDGRGVALVFGHEVKGVSPDLIPLLNGCIELPQSGTKHSLNIAVCCGIVCWEFYKKIKLP
jgi:23S rRNA (guanosine2251-2'-O)-methyltransferase